MILSTIAIFVVFIILILLSIAYLKTHKILCKTINSNSTPKHNNIINSTNRKSLQITTTDNIDLVGYTIEPNTSPKGIIIACHNLGGSKEAMFRYARFLCDAGYTVTSFDFRNHGESGKAKGLTFNRQVDLEAIIEHTQKRNSRNLPIGILGLSMGSVAGLLYSVDDKNIKAIVVDGGPPLYKEDYLGYIAKINGIKNPFLKAIFIHICMHITDLSRISKKIKKTLTLLKGRPILFIQGEKDFMIPPRNTDKALELLSSDKAERWLVKDANHLTAFAMAKEEYKERVIAFFDKHLAGITPPQ